MENELEVGQSYSVNFLLDFLSQNNYQNIFLVSTNEINMLSLPRDKNFVVYQTQQVFLHRFSSTKPNSCIINNSITTLYYIKPE
jgi:hypothetical protein